MNEAHSKRWSNIGMCLHRNQEVPMVCQNIYGEFTVQMAHTLANWWEETTAKSACQD